MANHTEFGDDSLWSLAIQSYYPKIVNYIFLTEIGFWQKTLLRRLLPRVF